MNFNQTEGRRLALPLFHFSTFGTIVCNILGLSGVLPVDIVSGSKKYVLWSSIGFDGNLSIDGRGRGRAEFGTAF